MKITGTYIEGLGAASGDAVAGRVPGILQHQFDAIQRLRVPSASKLFDRLQGCHLGTINVKVPGIVPALSWDHVFKNLRWHPNLQPEDLHFKAVRLFHAHLEYDALLYWTSDREHSPSVLEVISPWVENLKPNRSTLTIGDAI